MRDIHKSIELFAGLQFLVIGLSHFFQPMAWVEYFTLLRSKGRAGVFFEGFLLLGFGGLIAAFHNVWSGLPAVLTVIGWLQVLKGLLRFTLPHLGLRIYGRVRPERAWEFRWAGIFSVALGGLFVYLAFAP
ncbi:MAG TPA: hypothetical protein VGS22_11165 [Thermoanaerobaculia bacterium]|jgi:uncharacterized protein YjeT (DUF2065 family)|nr:hypothetical protein [Thermoanaerobaculia bacterium]